MLPPDFCPEVLFHPCFLKIFRFCTQKTLHVSSLHEQPRYCLLSSCPVLCADNGKCLHLDLYFSAM